MKVFCIDCKHHRRTSGLDKCFRSDLYVDLVTGEETNIGKTSVRYFGSYKE